MRGPRRSRTRPSRTMTSRSAYAATRASWVTRTTVVPCSRADVDQQVHHLLAGQRVERPGRLVGEEHLGLGDQRPGQRDPLRLRRRTARRTGAAPARRGRAGSNHGRASRQRRRAARPAEQQRAGRRSPRRSARARADRTGRRTRTGRRRSGAAPGLAQLSTRRPSKQISPGVGHEDAGQAVQQGRLAGSARTHDGEDLAGGRRRGWRRAARASRRRTGRRRAPRAACALTTRTSSARRRAGRRSGRSSAGRPPGGTGRGRRAARRPGRRSA